METGTHTPEAQSQAIARKLRRELKNPMWSVPDKIRLNPARETIVGRCASNGTHHVVLHSPKLPAMLSRKHACIHFNPQNKKWLVEDLEVGNPLLAGHFAQQLLLETAQLVGSVAWMALFSGSSPAT